MIAKMEFERALEDILGRVFLSKNGTGLVKETLNKSASGMKLGAQKTRHIMVTGEFSNTAQRNHLPAQPEMRRFPQPSMAVAYSGGLDSTALLHLACAYVAERQIPLYAFHIHHGLQKDADNWLLHCRKECERLGIRFDAKRVSVDKHSKEGVEGAARRSRYAALGELCRIHYVPLLLTAHHQDDQVETVLLHLMRGSGVAGLSGMSDLHSASELFGNDDLVLARPLLSISRDALEDWVVGRCLPYVEDPSNTDVRYMRNAIRHEIMPVLERFFPSAQNNLIRTAQHAQFARKILDEVARQDWETYQIEGGLSANCLHILDQDRANNLLRYWLHKNDMRMPSTAWLEQAYKQLRDAKQDAQIEIALEHGIIRRYRNRVSIQFQKIKAEERPEILSFAWNGEREQYIDEWHGTFLFKEADEGVDADWLRHQALQIRSYRGTEKLRLAPNRHERNLKAHYQTSGIPGWERHRLPLLYAENELLFAAGVGLACQFRCFQAGKCIQIDWQPDD